MPKNYFHALSGIWRSVTDTLMYFVILVQNDVTLCKMTFTVDFQTESKRYSLRQGTRKSYKNLEVEDDDIYVCKCHLLYFYIICIVYKAECQYFVQAKK